jgi:exodeoxyribonuclease VII small subunit
MTKADGPRTGRSQPDIFPSDSPPPSAEAPSPVSSPDVAGGGVEDGTSPRAGDKNPSAAFGTDPLPASFESALNQLEAIVARMESGELSLEESLSAYKRGAALLQYCQGKLHDAQQQVKILEAGVLRDFSGASESGQ